MTYDEDLANRVRKFLPQDAVIIEKRMFGSLAFMFQNNMICAVMNDGLMARVGSDYYEEALNQEYTSEMNLTGRSMKNIVLVSMDGLDDDELVSFWIKKCMNFVKTLPPKEKKEPKKRSTKKRSIL